MKLTLKTTLLLITTICSFACGAGGKTFDDSVKSDNKPLVDTFCKNKQNQSFSCYISKTIYDESNKQYLAVGTSLEFNNDGGALILISKNGIDDWNVVHDVAKLYPALRYIIKANSQYFAAGVQGTILSSVDGVSYQKVNLPNNSISFANIAYNGQKQIIALGNDINTKQLYSAISNDNGLTWQLNQIVINNGNAISLIVNNTIWDDQLEQYVSIVNSFNPTDEKNIGKHATLISKDGLHWTAYAMDSNNYGGFEGNTLTKYKNMYLAGGVSMSLDGKIFANLMWSTDGKNWNNTNDPSITSIKGVLSAITTNNNEVVLVIKEYGDQTNLKLTILKSMNGLSDYQIVSHQFYESTATCAYNAIWDGQKYLISGMLDAADDSKYKEQILYSYDAKNWQSPITQDRP